MAHDLATSVVFFVTFFGGLAGLMAVLYFLEASLDKVPDKEEPLRVPAPDRDEGAPVPAGAPGDPMAAG